MCLRPRHFKVSAYDAVCMTCDEIYGTIQCPGKNNNQCETKICYRNGCYLCRECDYHLVDDEWFMRNVYPKLDAEGQATVQLCKKLEIQDVQRWMRCEHIFKAETLKEEKRVDGQELIQILTNLLTTEITNRDCKVKTKKYFVFF